MADPEIRVRLPSRLGDRIRSEGGHPQMDDLLQPQTPTLGPWRQTTRRALLAEKRQNPTRSAGAKSSLIYARSCPTDGE